MEELNSARKPLWRVRNIHFKNWDTGLLEASIEARDPKSSPSRQAAETSSPCAFYSQVPWENEQMNQQLSCACQRCEERGRTGLPMLSLSYLPVPESRLAAVIMRCPWDRRHLGSLSPAGIRIQSVSVGQEAWTSSWTCPLGSQLSSGWSGRVLRWLSLQYSHCKSPFRTEQRSHRPFHSAAKPCSHFRFL